MFVAKDRKQQPSSLTSASKSRGQSPSDFQKQPFDSLQLLQRSLGNHYLQALSLTGRPSDRLLIQRTCACGGSCADCIQQKDERRMLLQPKLMVGAPNDVYEQEADRVADQVMRMPEPKIQRVCPECEEKLQRQPMEEEEKKKEEEDTLQTKPLAESITPLIQRQMDPTEEEKKKEEETLQTKTASGKASTVSPALQNQITALQGGGQPLPESERYFFEPRFGTDFGHEHFQPKHVESGTLGLTEVPPSVLEVLRSPGQPIDPDTRAFMEPRFNADFSSVRIHTDSQANESARLLNSKAFTFGNNIIFRFGEYSPESHEGKRLIAHELTHVVQGATPSGRQNVPGGIIRRQLQSTLEEIDSLLSYGVFDWVITDEEAIRALELLSNIPRNLLGTALRRVNIGRLRENLPVDHRNILDRLIAEASGTPAADFNTIVDRINSLLSYGIFDWAVTDSDAREAFSLLKSLSLDDQRRAILIINSQRLLENLPDERDRNELVTMREGARAVESSEYATMEGYRARARTILSMIKAEADSMTLPAPPSGGVFENWLSANYLTDYCANPNSDTAQAAIDRIGEQGSGGFSTYGYQLLRGLADRIAPTIDYIDSPYFLGTPAPVTSGSELWDPWSQGPNLTNIMHFATGVKYSHVPEAIIQALFIWYERHSREGWQIFGLDSLNDIIAEEGGRLLAIDMKAGSASCSSGQIDLDPYFQRGRRFLRSELSESRLERVALAVHQPLLVVAVDPAGNALVSRELWTSTIMEQVMAGASDTVILNSADAAILKILFHLVRRG